jgi:uncharacterized iron-regulated membrane protein
VPLSPHIRATLAGLRRVLFWSHLVLGIAAGSIILLMSVTGVMLGFERQMIAWWDGAPRVQPPAEATRLPVDSLLALAGVRQADVATVVIKRDDTQPVAVRFRDRDREALALDPFTGAALTRSGDGSGAAFFSGLRRWHRYVGAQAADLRARGKAVTGAANLAFLFIIASGLYLWFPRRAAWHAFRAVLVPSARLRGKARDFNWHHVAGFWTAVPMFLIVLTAAFISYRWPGQYLDLALGNAQERAAAAAALRGEEVVTSAASAPRGVSSPDSAAAVEPEPVVHAALGTWVATAAAARPQWQQLSVTLPGPRDSAVSIAAAEGNTYRPDLRWTLSVGATTGALVSSRGYEDLSTARQLRAWVRFGHTGEVFGLWGQLVATLVTAAGVVLVWTGVALSLRRLAAFVRRRRRGPPGGGRDTAAAAPPSEDAAMEDEAEAARELALR